MLEFRSAFLRLRQPRVNQPECRAIDLNIERPPLAGESAREPDHAGLGRRVVALTEIAAGGGGGADVQDRKSTRLNSSHRTISYAVFCLKKKKENEVV